MKSPMVQNASYIKPAEKVSYSDLQVMQSNAGYYVGTICTGEDGFQEPGSRDTGYFRTRKEAEAALKEIEGGGGELREHP
jgi:hypothetical protein